MMDRHDRIRFQYINRFQQTATVHRILSESRNIPELRGTDMEDTDVDRIARSDAADAVEEYRIAGNIDDAVLLSGIFNDEACGLSGEEFRQPPRMMLCGNGRDAESG